MRSFTSRLLKRYLVVLIAFFIAYVLIKIYYVYFYNGLNDQASEGLIAEIIGATMLVLLISSKYFIFDALAMVLRRKANTAALEFISYVALVVAFTIDVFALFASLQPTTDSGFAILISIIVSPVVLLAGLAIMLIILAIHKIRSNKQSN